MFVGGEGRSSSSYVGSMDPPVVYILLPFWIIPALLPYSGCWWALTFFIVFFGIGPEPPPGAWWWHDSAAWEALLDTYIVCRLACQAILQIILNGLRRLGQVHGIFGNLLGVFAHKTSS